MKCQTPHIINVASNFRTMEQTIKTYDELSDIFSRLGINSNIELGLLPENLSEAKSTDEFIYSDEATDLRKIFKSENIDIEYITHDKPLLRSRKNVDWFGPAIFIGFSVLYQNDYLISVMLNLISSHIYDFFKDNLNKRKVKLDIVVETSKNKTYQKISYEGGLEGIKDLEGVIKKLKK